MEAFEAPQGYAYAFYGDNFFPQERRPARHVGHRAPPLTDEEHLVKVRDCLSKRLPPEKMERCIALARSVDTLGPREVVELLGIAGCSE